MGRSDVRFRHTRSRNEDDTPRGNPLPPSRARSYGSLRERNPHAEREGVGVGDPRDVVAASATRGPSASDQQRRPGRRRPQVRRHGGRRVGGHLDRDGGGRRAPLLGKELDRRHDVGVRRRSRARRRGRRGSAPIAGKTSHRVGGGDGPRRGAEVFARSQRSERSRDRSALEREQPDRGRPGLGRDRVGAGGGRTVLLLGEPARGTGLILARARWRRTGSTAGRSTGGGARSGRIPSSPGRSPRSPARSSPGRSAPWSGRSHPGTPRRPGPPTPRASPRPPALL